MRLRSKTSRCLPPFVVAALVLAGVASASSHPQLISVDTYTNTTSYHRTQVEPDSFSFGSTIVAAFQTGRFFDGGASNVGFSTSTDGGSTWTAGVLPGTTVYQGGPWARVSDPAVAYDPEHDVWMISTLAINDAVDGAAVLTSRSTDGGLTWQNPVTVSVAPGTFYDKNWIVCDTWAASPNYGNCYTEWDDNGLGNRLFMSTSTDGGLTWGPKLSPSGLPSGLGGQPVAQPNGNVIVPYTANFGSIRSFRSTNGGGSWTSATTVTTQSTHSVAGGLRDPPLPSAEVDSAGRVYVVWHDCRYRSGCSANDIVMSTSLDGVTWTAVQRVPIDATTSGVDHFIPGIGVDRTTSGATARLGLAYYYYPVSACTSATCRLRVGFISSSNGGSTWSSPSTIGWAMNLAWIAPTSQGRMVGDYISTSFVGSMAHPVFSLGLPARGSQFAQSTYADSFAVAGPRRLSNSLLLSR